MNFHPACCNHNCWMINCESNLPGLTVWLFNVSVANPENNNIYPVYIQRKHAFPYADGPVFPSGEQRV